MLKQDIIKKIIGSKIKNKPNSEGFAFAPVNIALCKYWGKRDEELNLPFNSSLSISLGEKGAFTKIIPHEKNHDDLWLNGKQISQDSAFAKRLQSFLDLFRSFTKTYYHVETTLNVPMGAGLASSACGFAALVKALDHLYNWRLTETELSILARLGSGSACRSMWKGFVEWSKGEKVDGMDSYGKPLSNNWSELRVGLLILNSKQKSISSREAMSQTVKTSKLYKSWPERAEKDLQELKTFIKGKNFKKFGEIIEANALLMHETMFNALPSINYSSEATINVRNKINKLRQDSVEVYFTQDAGPNLKLLFLEKDTEIIRKNFPNIEIIVPFVDYQKDQVVLVDENDKSIGIEEKMIAHQKGKLHRAFSVFIIRSNPSPKSSQQTYSSEYCRIMSSRQACPGKACPGTECREPGDMDMCCTMSSRQEAGIQLHGCECLLQQRQKDKYHSPNLWSNTCCSHPKPGEDIISAAERRLNEEMGIKTKLQPIGKFQYRTSFTNGLIENELDYVLIGELQNKNFIVNQNEVQDYKWTELKLLQKELAENPNEYTPWLGKALELLWDFIYNGKSDF